MNKRGRGKSRYTQEGESFEPLGSSFSGRSTGVAEWCTVCAGQHVRAPKEEVFVNDNQPKDDQPEIQHCA
jgi:hypothetical protein